MDKVDVSQGIERFLNIGNTKTATRKTHGKTGTRESSRSEFSEILESSFMESNALGPIPEITPSEEAVQELLDAVQSTGNELKRKPLPNELLEYKKAVRNFIHYVLENCYELLEVQGIVKKTTFRGKTEWKTTIFHQVRIVDQKLNQLAAETLTRHISELDLRTKVDEITGLLVDLTVTGRIRERDE
jgi:hypothetical protein